MYEAVEEIFQACVKFCQPGEYSLNDIFSVMMALTARQLIRLGVVPSSISDRELSQVTVGCYTCNLSSLL